jgi:CHRD domain
MTRLDGESRKGQPNLPDAEAGRLRTDGTAGCWYVNVMTIEYPKGEIRGQILPIRK